MKKRSLLIFLVVYSILFGLIHRFAFSVATRSLNDNSLTAQLLLGIFTLGWLAIPTGLWVNHNHNRRLRWLVWTGYIWLGFFTILMLFVTAEFFISLYDSHAYSYWVLAVSLPIAIYSLRNGLKPPTVVIHQMKGPESLRGFRLVQISDVHLGMLNLNAQWFTGVIQQVNKLHPNVLAITGDLTDAAFATVKPMLAVFSEVDSKIQKFYITGNHEYIHFGPWESEVQNYNVKPLHNTHEIINFNSAKILIAGIPDLAARQFNRATEANPDLALKTTETVNYRILLAHQPTAVFKIEKEPCDLMLSGHTHGGQIFPFHVFVRMAMPLVKGFKKINQVLVFTHQGTGFWGPPMRWFSQSEIVLFEWI